MTTQSLVGKTSLTGSTSSQPLNVGAPPSPAKPATKVAASSARPRFVSARGVHVAGFYFAFVVFLLFGGGLMAMGWGTAVHSPALAITGLMVALAGGTMYGRSLSEE